MKEVEQTWLAMEVVAQARVTSRFCRRAGGAERCGKGSGYQSCVEANLAGFGGRWYSRMFKDSGIKSMR